MRIYLAILFVFTATITNAQTVRSLKEVSSNDTLETNCGMIYGLFVQRLGFSSGGFPQDIRVKNITSNEVYSFRVKPTFKLTKENIFMFKIPAGEYAILHYWWTQSKWYGGKMFTEPIFKNVAFSEIEPKLKSGELKEEELEQYKFTVEPLVINYTGTWHFDKEKVSFSNDKETQDEKIGNSLLYLDLKKATTSIPN